MIFIYYFFVFYVYSNLKIIFEEMIVVSVLEFLRVYISFFVKILFEGMLLWWYVNVWVVYIFDGNRIFYIW